MVSVFTYGHLSANEPCVLEIVEAAIRGRTGDISCLGNLTTIPGVFGDDFVDTAGVLVSEEIEEFFRGEVVRLSSFGRTL
jgi:hypothetical protein